MKTARYTLKPLCFKVLAARHQGTIELSAHDHDRVLHRTRAIRQSRTRTARLDKSLCRYGMRAERSNKMNDQRMSAVSIKL